MRRVGSATACQPHRLSLLAALTLLVAGCNVYDESLLDHKDRRRPSPTTPDSGRDVAPDGGDAASEPPSPGPRPDGGLAVPTGPDAQMDGEAPDDDDAGMDPMSRDGSMDACGMTGIDSDADGTEDCDDGCPNDPEKLSPGLCGCGHPDTDDGVSTECRVLRTALRHRYAFNGTGTAVVDSVGGADGVVEGTSLSGSGSLQLGGGSSEEHVRLPSGLLSALPNATIEMWIGWVGGDRWQRLFDFGVDGPAALGNPSGCTNDGPVRAQTATWYYFCTNSLEWSAARDVCSDGVGGSATELLRVDDAAEQMFVISSAPAGTLPMWIGANDGDFSSEGDWRWRVNGDDRGAPFWDNDAPVGNAYAAWRENEPNNGNGQADEDCGEIHAAGWNDLPCDMARPFICEAPADSARPYSSLYLTPSGLNLGQPRVGLVPNGQPEQDLDAQMDFPTGTRVHVVVVYDDDHDTVALYVDGKSFGSTPMTEPLSALRDEQNYLGKSHFARDPELAATLHDVRIYDRALGPDLIAISGRAGPDAMLPE